MPPDENSEVENPELHSDAAGWALGALDPDAAIAFETHLHDCTECQATVAGFEEMTRALKSPAPAVEPPPDLASKTLAAVQLAVMEANGTATAKTPQATVMMAVPKQEDATVVSVRQAVNDARASEDSREPPPSRMSKWWHWHWNFPVFSLAAALGAAAAAAVVVFAQIGLSAAPALASTNIPLASTVKPTPGQSRPKGHAVAYRHTASNWQIKLTVKDLPRLGPGQFYECWYAGRGNSPTHPNLITAGTFTARTGTFTMWSAASPRKFKLMKITVQSAQRPGTLGTTVLQGLAR